MIGTNGTYKYTQQLCKIKKQNVGTQIRSGVNYRSINQWGCSTTLLSFGRRFCPN